MKESVLNFGSAGGLVGVLTRPDGAAVQRHPGLAVVMLNAGVLHRVGPHRMHVRLARHLAESGVTSFRFDLPGVGDSRALEGSGTLLADAITGIQAALDMLQRRGVASRFVVFGLCSGADHALMIACWDPRVVGIAVVDPTRIFPTWKAAILRLGKLMARPEVWLRTVTGRYGLWRMLLASLRRSGGRQGMSRTDEKVLVREELAKLAKRGVRICYLITSERRAYVYRDQFVDAFPGIGLGPLTEVVVFPRASHTFTREADRLQLERAVDRWLASEVFPQPPEESLEAAADAAPPDITRWTGYATDFTIAQR